MQVWKVGVGCSDEVKSGDEWVCRYVFFSIARRFDKRRCVVSGCLSGRLCAAHRAQATLLRVTARGEFSELWHTVWYVACSRCAELNDAYHVGMTVWYRFMAMGQLIFHESTLDRMVDVECDFVYVCNHYCICAII